MDDIKNGAEYYQEINNIVQACIEESKEFDREFDEVLHEAIDGHQWVIYTHFNRQVLQYSANESYAADNYGSESLIVDGQINWAGLAYGAMYGDCLESSAFEELEAGE